MNTNCMKCRAAHAARKLSAVAACGLLVALALGARAAAQDCPNVRNFGEQTAEERRGGEAAVNGRRDDSLLLGDTAALGRGPLPLKHDASFLGLTPATLGVAQVLMLDRHTTLSVTRRPNEPFYRLRLLSWFVEVRPDGSGRMTVDVDLGTFLRPGGTQFVKFLSDFEVKRTGSARAYLALSPVPLVNEGEWSSTQSAGAPARGN